MGKPREDWWEYIKRIIRSYPDLQRKAQSVGTQSVTAAYGLSGGHGSEVGRPVERAVVDRLNDKEQRRYDAMRAAIEDTEALPMGAERVALIRRVYWDRSHTLYGAAMCVPVSERTARRWNHKFIELVAEKIDVP